MHIRDQRVKIHECTYFCLPISIIKENSFSGTLLTLREPHWLRISDRIIFKILILTHKAFHGVAPVYLCELITNYEQATVRTRRAQDCFLLAIPPISKTCAASFFERSFLYAALTLWNKLSIDIRMLEFNQFKSRVKTELYLKYFEP